MFSAGVNVRFENGTVSRGPVPREVVDFSTFDGTFDPGYLFSIPAISSGAETLVAASVDLSKIYSIIGSTVTDITPPTVTVGDTAEPFTHDFLGNVTYLNRRSNVPFKKASGDATFVPLTSWNSAWRCSVLRSYKDFLIALNVSKSGIEYPQMVKWSDLVQFGSDPLSWDETSTTNSAGENILNQMKGGIVDGAVLRDTFMIYGENEVWAMTYIGGQFIFDFRKRFDDIGVMNTNCVVEVDGQHFVFDRNDIIAHDGASKRSIVHGKNKDFIYRGLIRDLSHLCFVAHNAKLNEIHFFYPSQDRLAGFPAPTKGCNRVAAYNYRRDTMTFYDVPYVTASTYAAVVSGDTYESIGTVTYAQMGGTYGGSLDESERHQLLTSRKDLSKGVSASRIIGLDLVTGGRLSKPVCIELLKPAFVERIGIDLDEQGAAITAYKSLLKVYPQIAISGTLEGTVKFQFGANDTSGASPDWDEPQNFDPTTDYQLPVRRAGRYLAHRLTHTGVNDFSYSGFDATLTLRGKR